MHRVVTVNRNRLEICDWRFMGRTGIPRGTAGRPDRGRGAVPSASLDARQNKAGTSFSFIEIVLATPVSIKDSDCEGAAAERGAGVLGSTASPLDAPAAGEGYAGVGACRTTKTQRHRV